MALSDSMVEQLYVAPDWIGHGVGRRLLDLAKDRRPDGLELYCFQANACARRFYEGHGFVPVAFGDGTRNDGAPARRALPVAPSVSRQHAPSRVIHSRDGTPIAVFSSGSGPPLDPGPRRGRRPHDVPGHRTEARRAVGGPRHRPAGPRRLRRHAALRDRARVRGRRRRGRAAGTGRRRAGRRRRALVRRPMRARSGAADRRDPAGRVLRGRADAAGLAATAMPSSRSELAGLDRAGRPRELLETFLTPGRRHGRRRHSPRIEPTRSGRTGSPRRTRSPASLTAEGERRRRASRRWAASASRCSRSSAATACRPSPRRRPRWTRGWRTAASCVDPGRSSRGASHPPGRVRRGGHRVPRRAVTPR